jgi:hypothetical protein
MNLPARAAQRKIPPGPGNHDFPAVGQAKLWMPGSIQTKGGSPVSRWLLRNLPGTPMLIKDVVEHCIQETKAEKAVVETILWRLIQQGLIYQPQPGKITKLNLE